MMIFDAHLHNKNHEDGGFIIGLEGKPFFEGTLNNDEALKLHDIKNKYISFYYVDEKECMEKKEIGWKYLKYHPRREKYSPLDVIESIKINNPNAVIIDTLNEPYWGPYDYWKVARELPDITFIFAHSGGYLINDFIKICHFQPNVWIDFALTHTILGKYKAEEGLLYIQDAIKYALNSAFKDRVLLSSDFPFFNQDDVFDYYRDHVEILNSNYLRLFEIIK